MSAVAIQYCYVALQPHQPAPPSSLGPIATVLSPEKACILDGRQCTSRKCAYLIAGEQIGTSREHGDDKHYV
jgi:hypothetical protein